MSSVSVSVPIWFTFTRIAVPTPSRDPASEAVGVRDEHVVADDLRPRAELRRQQRPPVPVVLARAGPRARRSGTPSTSPAPERRPSSAALRVAALEAIRAVAVQLAGTPGPSRARPRRRARARLLDRLGTRVPSASAPSRARARTRPRRRRPSRARRASGSPSAPGTSPTPHRSASDSDAAPTGASMNSCSSSSLSACAPPLITFMNGTGRTCAFGPPRYAVQRRRRATRPPRGRPRARRRGSRSRRGSTCRACRRARAAAGRPRAGRAPRRPTSAGPMTSVTFATARSTPLPPKRVGSLVAQLDRPRARRSRRPTGRRRVRTHRPRAPRRPRRSGCRANRGSRVPGRPR